MLSVDKPEKIYTADGEEIDHLDETGKIITVAEAEMEREEST